MDGHVSSWRRARAWVALALPCTLVACSLYPDPAPEPRYFHPLLVTPPGVPNAEEGHDPQALRLRHVDAARHLTEAIAWRQGLELGYHGDWRWADHPAQILGQALDIVLFQSGQFRRSHESSTPSLDVHLLAFEQVVGRDTAASVHVHLLVEDAAGRVLLERWHQTNWIVEGQDTSPEVLAKSMGQALMAALAPLIEQLQEELGS